TNFFLADYEKHRGGLPCGRRREASEERHPACLSVLAFANIVTFYLSFRKYTQFCRKQRMIYSYPDRDRSRSFLSTMVSVAQLVHDQLLNSYCTSCTTGNCYL
ncbi:hypothetical protein ACIXEI_13215, partial [Bacteroides fragilis]